MMYDFVHLSKVGVNWASQLKEYQRILNEEPMDVLSNQSPFEVFFIEENLILWQEGSLVVSSALKDAVLKVKT